MESLQRKAQELLAAGTVKLVIGYGEGTGVRRRPIFVRTGDQAGSLVLDPACTQNLATYLTKAEVRALGRTALVATPSTLRSILQLAAERQVREENLLALVPLAGTIKELTTFADIEAMVATLPDEIARADQEMLTQLGAMSVVERRAFWEKELGRCVKCYACRAACPMCYCERCTMDNNRPQWVPVASHALGNLEYHVVRAMHLAGRCVRCGTCGAACPHGIPIHLLTFASEGSVRRQFGQPGGASSRPTYALATFKPDDKEDFIR
ncbi:MAG: 4Fe-4S dicluster domain-containing protein [Polyangia bacterium]|jgi:ferredoxin